jgi:hypothetical protein
MFTQCQNGTISGCTQDPMVMPSPYNGCTATTDVIGTGFDLTGAALSSCEGDDTVFHGGATGWLTMSGNVTPGEVMTLQFIIWDTGDQQWDSTILLDDFQWSVNASEPGVSPN